MNNNYSELFTGEDFCEEKAWTQISELLLPQVIKTRLKPFVTSVAAELKRWVSRMNAAGIFDKDNKALWYLDRVVFSPRGNIMCEETGKNLLRDKRLTSYVKFRIACYYCLEEEALSRSALSLLNPEYRGGMKVSHRPEEFYFICVIDGNFESLDEQIRKTNRQITRYCYLMDLSAEAAWTNPALLKYVWRKMSDQERSLSMLHFIKYANYLCPALLLDLFSGSGETVMQAVLEYEDFPLFGLVMCAFLQDPLYLEFAVPLFLKLGNLMTEESFVKIFKSPIRKTWDVEVPFYEAYVMAFEQIWCSVDEHFKLRVAYCLEFAYFFCNLLESEELSFAQKILTDFGLEPSLWLLSLNGVLNEYIYWIKSFKRKTFDSFWAFIFASDVFVYEDKTDLWDMITRKVFFNVKRKLITSGMFKGIMRCLGTDDEEETEHRHFVRICEVIWTAASERTKNVVFMDGEVPLKIVHNLLRDEEFTFVKNIFDDAGDMRRKLVFSDEVKDVCLSWSNNHKWELLNMFRHQCLYAEDDEQLKVMLSAELNPTINEFWIPRIEAFE